MKFSVDKRRRLVEFTIPVEIIDGQPEAYVSMDFTEARHLCNKILKTIGYDSVVRRKK